MHFFISIIFLVSTFGCVLSVVVVYDNSQNSKLCQASKFALVVTLPELNQVEQQKLEHSTTLYAWNLQADSNYLAEYPLMEMKGLVCGFMMRLDGNETQQKKIHTLFVKTLEVPVAIKNLPKQDEIEPGKFLYHPIADLDFLDATLTANESLTRAQANEEANRFIIDVLWKYNEVKFHAQTSKAAGVAQAFFQREQVARTGIPDGLFAYFAVYNPY